MPKIKLPPLEKVQKQIKDFLQTKANHTYEESMIANIYVHLNLSEETLKNDPLKYADFLIRVQKVIWQRVEMNEQEKLSVHEYLNKLIFRATELSIEKVTKNIQKDDLESLYHAKTNIAKILKVIQSHDIYVNATIKDYNKVRANSSEVEKIHSIAGTLAHNINDNPIDEAIINGLKEDSKEIKSPIKDVLINILNACNDINTRIQDLNEVNSSEYNILVDNSGSPLFSDSIDLLEKRLNIVDHNFNREFYEKLQEYIIHESPDIGLNKEQLLYYIGERLKDFDHINSNSYNYLTLMEYQEYKGSTDAFLALTTYIKNNQTVLSTYNDILTQYKPHQLNDPIYQLNIIKEFKQQNIQLPDEMSKQVTEYLSNINIDLQRGFEILQDSTYLPEHYLLAKKQQLDILIDILKSDIDKRSEIKELIIQIDKIIDTSNSSENTLSINNIYNIKIDNQEKTIGDIIEISSDKELIENYILARLTTKNPHIAQIYESNDRQNFNSEDFPSIISKVKELKKAQQDFYKNKNKYITASRNILKSSTNIITNIDKYYETLNNKDPDFKQLKKIEKNNSENLYHIIENIDNVIHTFSPADKELYTRIKSHLYIHNKTVKFDNIKELQLSENITNNNLAFLASSIKNINMFNEYVNGLSNNANQSMTSASKRSFMERLKGMQPSAPKFLSKFSYNNNIEVKSFFPKVSMDIITKISPKTKKSQQKASSWNLRMPFYKRNMAEGINEKDIQYSQNPMLNKVKKFTADMMKSYKEKRASFSLAEYLKTQKPKHTEDKSFSTIINDICTKMQTENNEIAWQNNALLVAETKELNLINLNNEDNIKAETSGSEMSWEIIIKSMLESDAKYLNFSFTDGNADDARHFIQALAIIDNIKGCDLHFEFDDKNTAQLISEALEKPEMKNLLGAEKVKDIKNLLQIKPDPEIGPARSKI